MAVKKYKPTSPGRRGMSGHTFEEITKSEPERSLLIPKHKRGGRNNLGRIGGTCVQWISNATSVKFQRT